MYNSFKMPKETKVIKFTINYVFTFKICLKLYKKYCLRKRKINCYGKTKEKNKVKGSKNDRIKQPTQKQLE